ncbi:MAG: M14 family zinc carboxypeptidase [Patescibacteria group bacterium]
MQTKQIGFIALAVAVVAIIGYFLYMSNETLVVVDQQPDEEPATTPEPNDPPADETEPTIDPEPDDAPTVATGPRVLGTTAGGNDITAHHFGTGETEILLIGGIHGGYSWNTALLGYELVDYFEADESRVPENLRVTVIPVLNPDGIETTLGTTDRFAAADALATTEAERVAGRFNANDVDLNRNFDCEWTATAQWREQEVSGGSAPFSEPAAQVIRDYINVNDPAAAIVWFSAEGVVYPASCDGIPSNAANDLADTFSTAANYPVTEEFIAYTITGDMANWFARQEIPTISVLLTDHQNTEWSKNRAGVEAVLNAYAE